MLLDGRAEVVVGVVVGQQAAASLPTQVSVVVLVRHQTIPLEWRRGGLRVLPLFGHVGDQEDHQSTHQRHLHDQGLPKYNR